FLSCMSFKRADYLLPAYPGFALALGCAAERLVGQRDVAEFARIPLLQTRNSGEFRYSRRGGIACVFAGVAVAVCLGWTCYNAWVVPQQEDGGYQRIAAEVRAHTERPVIFFRGESHVLAFHMGRPVDTILEWENLEWWAARP